MKLTTDKSFKDDIANAKVPVLVYFGASWCGPCKMLGPIMESIGTEMGNSALVLKVDVDANPELSAEYGITTVPTVLAFDGSTEECERVIGLNSKETYVDIINELS